MIGLCRSGVLVPAAAILVAACATIVVGTQFDHEIPFANYHTFAWVPARPQADDAAAVVSGTRQTIEETLLSKGFQRTDSPTAADLLIDFNIGSQMRSQMRIEPPPAGGRWWNLEDWWGHPGSDYVHEARRYREGTLTITVFDARTNTPIWQGWATKRLTRSDVEHWQGPVRRAAHAILERFPPTAARPRIPPH